MASSILRKCTSKECVDMPEINADFCLYLRQFAYDFKNNFLSIDGKKMHFIDEGCGEPIIMLHGNPSWSFYYRYLVHALKNQYHVIVPDHIGCGLSEKPSRNEYSYTVQQRVHDLNVLLEQLRMKNNLTLVLHDWGGFIGMAYAVQHPESIARIIVLNTSVFHLPKQKRFPWLLRLARSTIGKYLVVQHNFFARGTAWIGCQAVRMPKLLREAYCCPYDSPSHRIALWEFVHDIPVKPNDYSYSFLSSVQKQLPLLEKVPMLICWGMKDFVFDKHILEQWQRCFPNALIHRFPRHGHYVLEDAKEEVIPLVKQFLIDHPLRKKNE